MERCTATIKKQPISVTLESLKLQYQTPIKKAVTVHKSKHSPSAPTISSLTKQFLTCKEPKKHKLSQPITRQLCALHSKSPWWLFRGWLADKLLTNNPIHALNLWRIDSGIMTSGTHMSRHHNSRIGIVNPPMYWQIAYPIASGECPFKSCNGNGKLKEKNQLKYLDPPFHSLQPPFKRFPSCNHVPPLPYICM